MISRVALPNNGQTYRFGFNGKENDNGVKGLGNQQDYGMRIYDPRVGRFLSVDPLTKEYPWLTSYQFSGNNPILFIDLDGLEQATVEQQKRAINVTTEYALKNNTLRVFSNITKQGLVDDLARQIKHPESSTIPEGSGLYCGLYAFAYAYTYYDPEGFAKGVLDLVQKGEATTAGGKKVKTSESLRHFNINKNISAFIFTAAVRETYNNFLTATKDGKYWGSTGSGDMKKWLSQVGNLNVKEFSYGHEETMDGITDKDLAILKRHTDAGNLALLRVSYNQFIEKKDEFGAGAEATIAGGDHWVVLKGIVSYDVNKNTITIDVYDNHGGRQPSLTMELSRFKDMIYHVLMVERKKEQAEKKN
jgi:RHS repeat-associated protein